MRRFYCVGKWLALLALAAPAAAQVPARAGDLIPVIMPVCRQGDTLRLVWQGPNDFRYRYGLPVDEFICGPQVVDSTPPAPTPLPSAGVLFASDWSSGDVCDGGMGPAGPSCAAAAKWDLIGGNGDLNDVVPSTGLDFPTARVLRVRADIGARSDGGAASQSSRLQSGLPDLAVGQTRYYRVYLRVSRELPVGVKLHPLQDAIGGSGTNWELTVDALDAETWALELNVGGGRQNPIPYNRWGPAATALQEGQTYTGIRLRREVTYLVVWSFTAISPTQFTAAARLCDSRGNLVAGESAWKDLRGTKTLADKVALNWNNRANFAGLQVGFNGMNPGEIPAGVRGVRTLLYWADLVVHSETWGACG